MRSIIVLLALTGCDPVWRVENAATARSSVTSECIVAGLEATGLSFREAGEIAKPAHGWYVGDPSRPELRVNWDPRESSQRVALGTYGVGTSPPAGAPDAYRRNRDIVVAALQNTCGPIEVGPESCARTSCR